MSENVCFQIAVTDTPKYIDIVLDCRNVFLCVGAHFSERIVWSCFFFLKKEEVGLRG